MEANPYAPPDARVADVPRDSHGLKRRSVLLMIVFMIITFGFYYPWWWFRRRPGLNRLDSPKKLALWPLLLMAAMFALDFGVGVISGTTPQKQVIGESGVMALLLIRVAVSILIIIQTFRVKDMIEDHATPETGSGPMFVETVTLSGLMTFFFSVFYLQWAINHYVVGRPAETA